jgi:carboxypeptidase Taq
MSTSLDELRERMAQLSDLRSVSALAHWDQQTKMPPHGAPSRAESLATLQRLSHELFIDDETGRLLEGAEAETVGAQYDSDDACLVRLIRRQWDKARRVPPELAAEMARAASMGQEAWVAAREASNFRAFAPYLERNYELARRYVECHAGYDGYECAYDVLLDDYEPDMKTSTVARLFSELRTELVPLITRLSSEAARVDDSMLYGHFPPDHQRPLVDEAVTMMGFDPTGWRIDDTVHPFAIRIGRGDVRITTRWDESYFPAGLYGAMHECGHGLYEAGIPPAFERSPLGAGESLGMHESQSRLWENMVGWASTSAVTSPGSTPTPCTARSTVSGRPTSASSRTSSPTRCTSCCASSSSRSSSRAACRSPIFRRPGMHAFRSSLASRSPTTPMVSSRTCTGRRG